MLTLTVTPCVVQNQGEPPNLCDVQAFQKVLSNSKTEPVIVVDRTPENVLVFMSTFTHNCAAVSVCECMIVCNHSLIAGDGTVVGERCQEG